MSDFIAGYFPRIHTAIAEFLACMVFLLPMQLRGDRTGVAKEAVRNALFLALLLANFAMMERVKAQGLLWMALMLLGMALMFGRIYAQLRKDLATALYCWAYAFLLAELAASLEWQINYYLIRGGVISSMAQTYICMGAVYALVFGAVYLNGRRAEGRTQGCISMYEAYGAVGIAVGAFVISNIQFVFQDSWFTASMGDGTLYARTLVDISGIIMLYAHGEQRKEMALRYELDAMTSLLYRQYEQYQQFEANNEAMHRVYHDLKHQIAYLESETNSEKRQASLKEMKEIIRTSESHVNTGNNVLDVLLTSKSLICAEEGIQITCYADAKLLHFMDVMDVCSIFGNTIDNAIECERKVEQPSDRLISVHVGARGAFLLIRIRNFCEGQVRFVGDTPETTKADKQLHGYGLKSVRRSAEKYQGHMSLAHENGWFTVTVLIPLPKGEPVA